MIANEERVSFDSVTLVMADRSILATVCEHLHKSTQTNIITRRTRDDGKSEIVWSIPTSLLQDDLRLITSFITSSPLMQSQAIWLGVNDDFFSGQLTDRSFLLGEQAASYLNGYYECSYLGDFIRNSQPHSIYQLKAQIIERKSPLIGRDQDITTCLLHCKKQNKHNRPAVIHIQGPAGIGKSSIASELCQRTATESTVIIKERYSQGGNGGDTLASICPRSDDIGTRLASLCSHLRHIGQHCILWIEDIHWAPASDCLLLSTIAKQKGFCCLVFVTSRSDENKNPITASLDIHLQPFSESDCADLIQKITAHQPNQNTLTQILKCTLGNPLMLTEFINGSLATGALRVQRGMLNLCENYLPNNGILELHNIVRNALARLPKSRADAIVALSLFRKGMNINDAHTYLSSCSIRPVGTIEGYAPYYLATENSLVCRHDLIRDTLVSLVPKDLLDSYHLNATRVHQRLSNWPEVYYHANEMSTPPESLLHKSLVKAFHQTWDSQQIEQCFVLGKKIDQLDLKQIEKSEYCFMMGILSNQLGKMTLCARWMKKATSGSMGFHLLGLMRSCIPLSKKIPLSKSHQTYASLLAESYHLRADALWTDKKLYASASCLFKSANIAGMQPYPNTDRCEANSGLAIFFSATPFKKHSLHLCRASLKEAVLAGDYKKEMRVRILCSVALLGTPYWKQVLEICLPAYQWAKKNGQVQIQIQAAINITLYHVLADNRKEAIRFSKENYDLAMRGSDQGYLRELVRAHHVTIPGMYSHSNEALRELCDTETVHTASIERSASLAGLCYAAGDTESAKEHIHESLHTLKTRPATSYGVTFFLNHMMIAILGLWGQQKLSSSTVQSALKQLRKQARAFTIARPIYLTWLGVSKYCRNNNLGLLLKSLKAARLQAQHHQLNGQAKFIDSIIHTYEPSNSVASYEPGYIELLEHLEKNTINR